MEWKGKSKMEGKGKSVMEWKEKSKMGWKGNIVMEWKGKSKMEWKGKSIKIDFKKIDTREGLWLVEIEKFCPKRMWISLKMHKSKLKMATFIRIQS